MKSPKHRFYDFSSFRLDTHERVLFKDGEPVPLTHKVFDTLVFLVENQGRILSKDELLESIWQDAAVEEQNLKINIYHLRKALGETGDGGLFIQTLPKRGYRFVADVTPVVEGETEIVTLKHTRAEIIIDQNDNENDALITAQPSHTIIVKETAQTSFADKFKIHRNKLIIGALCLIIIVGVSIGWRFLNAHSSTNVSFENMRMTRLSTAGVTGITMSPDGKYVTYGSSDKDGVSYFWLKQIATDTTTLMWKEKNVTPYSVAFTADSSYIYITLNDYDGEKRDGLYRIPLLGKEMQKVSDRMCLGVTFSPNGKYMAYKIIEGGKDAIYIANADGSNERMISPLRNRVTPSISWSADSSKIAYTSKVRENEKDIWYVAEISLDGEEKVIGSKRNSPISSIAWLPDGNLLMSASDPATNLSQLWLMSYPSGEERRLTNDINRYGYVNLSTDGRVLTTTQLVRSAQVFAGDIDGKEFKTVTDAAGYYGDLAWAANGDIIFVSADKGNDELWSVSPDGKLKQLTSNMGRNSSPTVCADGRYIVFTSSRTGKKEIWRMDVDGRNPKQLTNLPFDIWRASCSPNGRDVFFLAWETIGWRWFRTTIEGGVPEKIELKNEPQWAQISPDGKWLAYVDYDGKKKSEKLIIKPFEGNAPVKEFDFSGRLPIWTSDSKAIAFVGNEADIWLQPVDGNPKEQIANFNNDMIFGFTLSPDGKQMAVTRGTQRYEAVLITFGENSK